jgi:leader peptidase (prepilin peptidase)/N-methyltransferase
MDIVIAIIFLLLGLVIGSFLNVCIDRLPAKQSIVSPPSHCPECGKKLAVKDLVPVFSYLLLKGRCRYCKSAIPVRVPIVEAATGIGFAALFYFFGIGAELAITLFYFSMFIVIFVIDLEHHLILNKVVFPCAVTAIIISIFLPMLEISPSLAIAGHFYDLGGASGIVSCLLGGVVGFVIFLLLSIITRGGMGDGDIKMVGLIGLMVGYPLIFVPIILAIVLGGIVALVLILFKLKSRKQSIAFGPFLAIGAMATILWGNDILNWYLSLLF